MSDMLEIDGLATYHAKKTGIPLTEDIKDPDHRGSTRLKVYPDISFFPNPKTSLTLSNHVVLRIDVDTSNEAENRIIYTHHTGVVQIVGRRLQGLADMVRKRHIAEIWTGKQAEGGIVEKIMLEGEDVKV